MPSESSSNAPRSAFSHPNLSKEDRAELEALDATIERMRTVTAPNPYILTIPQDVEPRFHHWSEQSATQWLHQTPFEWKEGERMQYQTFIYHEPGTNMFVQHPTRSKDDLNGENARKPGTGANTPNAGPKKKITLGAYKKKQTGGSTPAQDPVPVKKVDAPVKQAAVKGPVERVKAETAEVLAGMEDLEDLPVQDPVDEKRDLKRKRKEDESRLEQQEQVSDQPEVAPLAEEPVSKKARNTSPQPTPERQRQPVAQPDGPAQSQEKPLTPPATSDDTSLPPKLSPLEVPSLPSRLSPTIPPNIAEALKSREQLRSSSSDRSAPTSASKNGMLTPAKKLEAGITKRKSPANGFRANSSSPAVRSDTEERGRAPATSQPLQTNVPQRERAGTPELSQYDEIAVGQALKAKKQSKPSLVVKFKYKKHLREAVRRILGMRSKPVRHDAAGPESKQRPEEDVRAEKPAQKTLKRDPNAKGVAQKVGVPITNGTARKHDDKRLEAGKRPPAKEAEKSEVESKSSKPSQAGGQGGEQVKPRKPDTEPQPVETEDPSTAAKKHDDRRSESEKRPPIQHPENAVASSKPPQPSQESTHPAEQSKKRKSDNNESEELPTKRKKIPDSISTARDPSTPNQPDLLSPALLSSTQKQQQVTPTIRKDHVSIAMQRELSNDSNATATPSAKSGNTPVANGHISQPNGVVKAPSSQPSSKTPKQQAWENEEKRLQELGRKLKHAATDHFNTINMAHSDPDGASRAKQLAAVKAIESLLAFIFAFVCADEAALAADPKRNPAERTWRSLQAFYGFVKRNCESFPVLQGLACQLGVVFNARILSLSTRAPGVERASAQAFVSETFAALCKAAAEAEAKLDIDTLTETFPRTWTDRAKGAVAEDTLVPGSLGGAYKVPIGLATSPVHAARAGLAMLGEWVEREGVGYQLELKF